MILPEKMPEFFIIIARKIFFPNFRGARAPFRPSVSYAYELKLKFLYKNFLLQYFHMT